MMILKFLIINNYIFGGEGLKNLDYLVKELIRLPKETEWLEIKHNNSDPDMIGEYISALSNSAAYHGKNNAYVIWGIDDVTHQIVGTSFDYQTKKIGNEELENWLRNLLSDNANFSFYDVYIDEKHVVVLIILKAIYKVVTFKNIAYTRVGSYKKQLKKYPAIEVQLWEKINRAKFEELLAKHDLQKTEILALLDYSSYFDLLKISLPTDSDGIIHYLLEDKIIVKQDNGFYGITNLGAIMFAKKISDFPNIARKALRVIQYKGSSKVDTIRENVFNRGYANGFEEMVQYIEGLLPTREVIEGPLRKVYNVYPPISLRELVANALVHQDLSISGTGPTVEIFDNRIEITNPGVPLVDIKRFIDNPPKSRNELLASLMRRAHICEERGSGWDKVTLNCEILQLPAPRIDLYDENIKVTLYAHIDFGKLTQEEKLWSCYMHACLKQVSCEQMTNASLRDRFGVEERNKSGISRLIGLALSEKLIKPLDPKTAPRYMSYIPFWA